MSISGGLRVKECGFPSCCQSHNLALGQRLQKKRGLPLTQPPVGPTVKTEQYWEIQFGYDEETRFRQNILSVEEEWECPNQDMCGPKGNRVRRNVTCYSDWV